MYHIMIINDELTIHHDLKDMLDQKNIHCDVCTLWENEKNLWQIYESIQPDIIIIDMQTTQAKELPLLKAIRQKNHHAKIIVINECDDLTWVKEVLKAGANDYLLSSQLTAQTLQTAIEQAHDMLLKANEQMYENPWEYLQYQLLLSNHHLNICHEKITSLWKSPLFDPYRHAYRLSYFCLDHMNLYREAHHTSYEVICRQLANWIQRTIYDTIPYQIIFMSNYSGILLLPQMTDREVMDLCHLLMENISQHSDFHISMTLSKTIPEITMIFDECKQLLYSHKKHFYMGENSLQFVDQCSAFQPLNKMEITYHKTMAKAIAANDFQTLKQTHQEMMEYMKEHIIQPEAVLDYTRFLLNYIESEKTNKSGFTFHSMIQHIDDCETFDKLDECLQVTYQQLEQRMRNDDKNHYGKDISEIIEYVEKNYTKKLTLQMLANMFNINESYLSGMFKKQTGKNLIYFINEKKMNKARELLSNHDIMVKEVAYALGYDNQFYFNKLFKRFFHISPTDFRKNMIKQETMKTEK